MTKENLKLKLAAQLYAKFLSEYVDDIEKVKEEQLRELADCAFVATDIFLEVVDRRLPKEK